jgi:hypothetical protein
LQSDKTTIMAELAGSIIGIVSAGTKVALVLSQLAADVGSAGQEARMIGSDSLFLHGFEDVGQRAPKDTGL